MAQPELLSCDISLEGRLIEHGHHVLALNLLDRLELLGKFGILRERESQLQLRTFQLLTGTEGTGSFGEKFEKLRLLIAGEQSGFQKLWCGFE